MSGENGLGKEIGQLVALALIGVAVLDGIGAGVLAAIEHRDLSPGAEEYIEFAQLWLATGLLSATLAAATASWVLPPLFGMDRHWMVPIAILVGGAWLTGLPVDPEGGTPGAIVVAALSTFADFYGTAFAGGLVIGAVGAGIVALVAEHFGEIRARARGG